MKAFQLQLSDRRPIEKLDHHIFEEREARRDEAINKAEQIERDYEPEQSYGTAHDFQEHERFGGDRDNY